MSYKDLFLPLLTYPEAPDGVAIENAVAFAAEISAKVTAVAFTPDIVAPGNLLTDIFLNLPALAAAEEKKSAECAEELMGRFRRAAEDRRVFDGCKVERHLVAGLRDAVAAHARTHDLTIVPTDKVDLSDQWCVETVVFESGRPALLIPNLPGPRGLFRLDSVVVAFDFSRAAARALGDAIPVLKQAKRVAILTVENEKPIGRLQSRPDVKTHLARHEIDAEFVTVDAENRRIGDVLSRYVAANRADLLVMGAYGHSRMREFVLGGATKSMLAEPPLPIFLSH